MTGLLMTVTALLFGIAVASQVPNKLASGVIGVTVGFVTGVVCKMLMVLF